MVARVAGLTVAPLGDTRYRVTVVDGAYRADHTVTVTAADVERYAPGAPPERLLEASFVFLLEREPASAILPTFALPAIERYFPEYPDVIRGLIQT